MTQHKEHSAHLCPAGDTEGNTAAPHRMDRAGLPLAAARIANIVKSGGRIGENRGDKLTQIHSRTAVKATLHIPSVPFKY